MGKTTFDDDPDVLAMRGSMRPAAGATRWGRVLTGALVIGCATFAIAYHLPLQRAHATLSERFTQLQSQVSEANRVAEESRKQARALSEKQQALESQADQAKQGDKSRADASVAIKSALESKLDKAIAKNQATVGVAGTQAVASLALAQLLTPNKLDVSAAGKVTLCSVAGAAGERPIRVVAVAADKKSIPAPLAAKLKTPLQYSVAVAQAVTEALLTKCSVPGARLSAVGVPAEPASSAKLEGKKLSGARVELWID